MKKETCPICKGKGERYISLPLTPDSEDVPGYYIQCYYCNGKGIVEDNV